MTTPAAELIQLLSDGNARFVAGETQHAPVAYARRDAREMQQQHPSIVVVCCSDARLQVAQLFDQDIGDLFIVRVAGNVIASSQLGSIEYAVDRLGARLVVVLGHTGCGAVEAVLEDVTGTRQHFARHLGFLADRIRPMVAELVASNRHMPKQDVLKLAVRANVRTAIHVLETESNTLRRHLDQHDFSIVGAEYSLLTGRVEFLAA